MNESFSFSLIWGGWVMVFNATFNNISVKSWRSVLFVEETRLPGENHQPVASHIVLYRIHRDMSRIQTHDFNGDRHVVVNTITNSLSWSIEVLSILTFSINVYLFLFYNRNSKFAYDDIKEVHKRRYLLQPIAVEVFSSDGRNYLLVFPRKLRNKVYSK